MVDRVHSREDALIPGGDGASRGGPHTPGPWFPRFNGHFWDIGIGPVEHSPSVASVYLNPHADVTDAVRRANALLIGAAPDLLEACMGLIAASDPLDEMAMPQEYAAVRSAIAKATGRSGGAR